MDLARIARPPHPHFPMRLLSLLLLCTIALFSGGCAWHKKPKNETHIYGGDAPSIKYETRQERAGGRLQTY
jgi:hypothetical protein